MESSSPISNGNNNNTQSLSDVSSKNIEDQNIEEQNIEHSPPTEEEEANPDAPPQHLDDQEYVCKYCDKTFGNKQALGGHQNAHKVERAMEKNMPAQNNNNNQFAYHPVMNSTNPYLNSYNRSHDFFNRSITNWSQPPYSSQIHINARPVAQTTVANQGYANQGYANQGYANQAYANPAYVNQGYVNQGYVPPRPLPGWNTVYSSWTPPQRIVPGFAGNLQRVPPPPGFGAGSSREVVIRPVTHGLAGYAGPRIRPDANPGGENRNMMMNDAAPVVVNEEVDESELDLTLKL